MTGPVRPVRRGLRVIGSAVLFVGLAAAPAGAADGDAGDAAYYRSSVTQIRPDVPGLQVRVGATDSRITLVNRTGKTVIVVGYAGEEYLRITPDGVSENVDSLSSALNAAPNPGEFPSTAADAVNRPARWVTRSSAPEYTWRDYRVMWTNARRPPVVAADPHQEHQVFRWGLQLRVDSQPVLVIGEVRWTGTPWVSPLYVGLLTAVLLVLVSVGVVVLRSRRRARHRRAVSQDRIVGLNPPLDRNLQENPR